MNWYKHLAFLVVYTLGYSFLVFATIADGKGTFLFASLLVPWLPFFVAFALIPVAKSRGVKVIIVACMAFYYLSSIGIAIIEQTGAGNFERTVSLFNRNPWLFLLTSIWFITGQITLWVLLVRRHRNNGEALP